MDQSRSQIRAQSFRCHMIFVLKMSEEEEVTLEIEDTPIKCKKTLLMKHSDYFKAMFSGNFAEKDKKCIKLEDIDLNSMTIILRMLWDDSYYLEEENILLVLQTACLLQFENIRETCVNLLTEQLIPCNCLKIWFVTELLDIKPLYHKAKNLALIEFNSIKNFKSFLDLDIVQLHKYLSNIHLQCEELDVFNVFMQWYYENKENISGFLTCVDFNRATVQDIKEMLLFPDINNNTKISKVLKDILRVKTGDFVGEVVENKLLHGKGRIGMQADPLLFVNNLYTEEDENIEVFHDKYKRRRSCVRLGDGSSNANLASILIFDPKKCAFLKCLDISKEKYNGHKGFHLVGYKELIFLFGGEATLGSGNWNLNFWAYDTIRERWEIKTKMPVGRRHFDSCICGNLLYIVGGTGSFRIMQANMFWYNYKENVWSKLIMLPCSGHQLKCCNHNDNLFLLNMANQCGYVFVPKTCMFNALCIRDPKFKPLVGEFSLFSYNGRIFIKGSHLVELEIAGQELRLIRYDSLQQVMGENYGMESVLCKNILYTIYKHVHHGMVTMESFDMITFESKIILQDLENYIEIDGLKFILAMSNSMFSLQHHYKMGEEDEFINELEL